jgi:hypothetical protein
MRERTTYNESAEQSVKSANSSHSFSGHVEGNTW